MKAAAQLNNAIQHWSHVAPIVQRPTNYKEYYKLVNYLDELLDIVKSKENHVLISLVDAISALIEDYEEEHFPPAPSRGIDALKYLMKEHGLKQNDLPEIGSQGVMSEILNGKRQLSVRQIKLLAKRFRVTPATFIDD